jgi:hypothetical protein
VTILRSPVMLQADITARRPREWKAPPIRMSTPYRIEAMEAPAKGENQPTRIGEGLRISRHALAAKSRMLS